MIEGDRPPVAAADADPGLAHLAEWITRRLQAGDAVDPEVFARLHPALAGPIRGLLPTLNDLAELGRRHARDRRGRRAGPHTDPDAPGGCHEP